jgi:alpha-N-arabinofuranosidase
MTPWLEEHGTAIGGLADNLGGDERYFNNLVVNEGLAGYDPVTLPMFMDGNVYLNGATPSKHESALLVQPDVDPGAQLIEKEDGLYLQIGYDEAWAQENRNLVTTELLGKARTPDLSYLNYDGAALAIDIDYFGDTRNAGNLLPGPFSEQAEGQQMIKVWPKR